MHSNANSYQYTGGPLSTPRHVIFLGETGSGKSSIINLLLGAGDAPVSNDSWPCTELAANTYYETSLRGRTYKLWDTRGLGEGRSLFQTILGRGSEKNLKMFLRERHHSREIDLLVYCVHGSRTIKTLVKHYINFCAISRRLASPVVLVVTHLEKEDVTEDWWRRNSSALRTFKMDFDCHACVTTLPGRHLAESKEKLVALITRSYSWEARGSGSYFGSLAHPVQSMPPDKQMVWNHLQPKRRDNIDSGGPRPRQSINSDSSVTSSSVHDSTYYSAKSSTESLPLPPIVKPPTPHSGTASMNAPPININLLRNTWTMEPSPRSTSYDSSYSSCTSNPELFFEGNYPIFPGRRSSQTLVTSFPGRPPIEDLTGKITRRIGFPTQRGSFGDVWECDLTSGGSPRKVAVKAIKTTSEALESHQKSLRRELRIWQGLDHKNIVPLLGVVSDFGRLPSTVSPWFSKGSLSSYLGARSKLSVSKSRCLLRDIAAGLHYLHSQNIVHGDLHSGNVLIDDDGTAYLTDFGVSLINELVHFSYLMSDVCGGILFTDPALVKRVQDSRDMIYPTKPCDIYSFGGLMLHVISGKKPYNDTRSTSVLLAIINEERPQIPAHITPHDELVIRSCWEPEERNRPSANSLSRLFDGHQEAR